VRFVYFRVFGEEMNRTVAKTELNNKNSSLTKLHYISYSPIHTKCKSTLISGTPFPFSPSLSPSELTTPSGGMDILTTAAQLTITTPISVRTLTDLYKYIHSTVLTSRHDFFMDPEEEEVRPGILVLVNDTDVEVYPEGNEYVLKEGDTVAFISTLHGG